jgi:hypothetical protein
MGTRFVKGEVSRAIMRASDLGEFGMVRRVDLAIMQYQEAFLEGEQSTGSALKPLDSGRQG